MAANAPVTGDATVTDEYVPTLTDILLDPVRNPYFSYNPLSGYPVPASQALSALLGAAWGQGRPQASMAPVPWIPDTPSTSRSLGGSAGLDTVINMLTGGGNFPNLGGGNFSPLGTLSPLEQMSRSVLPGSALSWDPAGALSRYREGKAAEGAPAAATPINIFNEIGGIDDTGSRFDELGDLISGYQGEDAFLERLNLVEKLGIDPSGVGAAIGDFRGYADPEAFGNRMSSWLSGGGLEGYEPLGAAADLEAYEGGFGDRMSSWLSGAMGGEGALTGAYEPLGGLEAYKGTFGDRMSAWLGTGGLEGYEPLGAAADLADYKNTFVDRLNLASRLGLGEGVGAGDIGSLLGSLGNYQTSDAFGSRFLGAMGSYNPFGDLSATPDWIANLGIRLDSFESQLADMAGTQEDFTEGVEGIINDTVASEAPAMFTPDQADELVQDLTDWYTGASGRDPSEWGRSSTALAAMAPEGYTPGEMEAISGLMQEAYSETGFIPRKGYGPYYWNQGLRGTAWSPLAETDESTGLHASELSPKVVTGKRLGSIGLGEFPEYGGFGVPGEKMESVLASRKWDQSKEELGYPDLGRLMQPTQVPVSFNPETGAWETEFGLRLADPAFQAPAQWTNVWEEGDGINTGDYWDYGVGENMQWMTSPNNPAGRGFVDWVANNPQYAPSMEFAGLTGYMPDPDEFAFFGAPGYTEPSEAKKWMLEGGGDHSQSWYSSKIPLTATLGGGSWIETPTGKKWNPLLGPGVDEGDPLYSEYPTTYSGTLGYQIPEAWDPYTPSWNDFQLNMDWSKSYETNPTRFTPTSMMPVPGTLPWVRYDPEWLDPETGHPGSKWKHAFREYDYDPTTGEGIFGFGSGGVTPYTGFNDPSQLSEIMSSLPSDLSASELQRMIRERYEELAQAGGG